MAAELTLTAIDENARRHFERAWKEGAFPTLAEFLPPLDGPLYLGTLVELVQIELELAWKASSGVPLCGDSQTPETRPRRPLVEDYLARFPCLLEPAIVRRLIQQEFRVRSLHGDQPSPAEYRRRFPDLLPAENESDKLFVVTGHKTPDYGTVGQTPEEMPAVAGYELVREIGRGGMGLVYEARQPELDRVVALKTSRQKARTDGTLRFLTEAKIAARLEHPGVVPVHQLVSPPGAEPYYTMKLVRGRTLDEVIRHYHIPDLLPGERNLLRRRLLEAYLAVIRTMAFAHSRGVIHRDLKPLNIILGEFGETIILDWGLAKIIKQAEADCGKVARGDENPDITSTVAGTIIGTPAYMAPEQTLGRGDLVDERTDIYTLGAMLYEILTGHPPHSGETITDLLHRVETVDPVPPRSVDRSVPRPLQAICLHALAKRREDRYQEASLLARDVESLLAGEPVSVYREKPLERLTRWSRRHRTLATSLLVSGVLILMSVVAGIFLLDRAEQRRLHQASEFEQHQLREQAEQRLQLAHAAREDELLAHAEIQAGHFLEGARILQRAAERLAGEPELSLQRADLEKQRQRARSLTAFYARWDEAQRIAVDSPEVLVNFSDDEMVATCEQALAHLQVLKGDGNWWDRLPADELTTTQRQRLEKDAAIALGMMALWKVKKAFFSLSSEGYRESRKLLSLIQQYQAAHHESESASVVALDAYCQWKLGVLDPLGKPAPPPRDATDAYFLGITHLFLSNLQGTGIGALARASVPEHLLVRAGLDLKTPSATAEKLLRAAVAEEPANYWANLWLGRHLRNEGNLSGAEDAFNACVALRPALSVGYLDRSNVLFAHINLLEAERKKLQLPQAGGKTASPQEVETLSKTLARSLADEEAMKLRALHGLDEALIRLPRDAAIHWRRAYAEAWVNNHAGAVREMCEACALEAARLGAEAGGPQEKSEVAAGVLSYAATWAPQPGSSDPRGVLALANLALQNTQEAGALAGKLLEENSAHPQGLLVRGELARRQGRHAEAVADFSAVLKTRSDDPLALCGRALARQQASRPQEALSDFEQMLQSRPSGNEGLGWWELAAQLGRARSLAASGKTADAREAIEEARLINPLAAARATEQIFPKVQ